MTAFWQSAIGVHGAKMTLDGVEYDIGGMMSGIHAEPIVASCPGEFGVNASFEVMCEARLADIGFFNIQPEPTMTRLVWTHGLLNLFADTKLPAEMPTDVDQWDSFQFRFHAEAKAFAAIACIRCGQGRAYAGLGRVCRALSRWERHVCPRGTR